MATLPNAVTLANIADGGAIVASDHRNNYSAVQTFLNSLQAILAGGTAGQVLTSSGGTTVAYVNPVVATVTQFTSLVGVANTTTESDLVGTQGSGWTIPANTLGATDKLIVELEGDLTVANATAPNFNLRTYLGGTKYVDANIGSNFNGNGLVRPFQARIALSMRGATNSVYIVWQFLINNTNGGTAVTTGWGTSSPIQTGVNGGVYQFGSAGDQTVDMTASQALRLTAQWGTADVNNNLRIRSAKLFKI